MKSYCCFVCVLCRSYLSSCLWFCHLFYDNYKILSICNTLIKIRIKRFSPHSSARHNKDTQTFSFFFSSSILFLRFSSHFYYYLIAFSSSFHSIELYRGSMKKRSLEIGKNNLLIFFSGEELCILVEKGDVGRLIGEKCEKFTRGKFGLNFLLGFSYDLWDFPLIHSRTHTRTLKNYFPIRKSSWMDVGRIHIFRI